MSFILDALRKADANRADQPRQKLGAPPPSTSRTVQRRRMFPLIAGIVGIVAATVIATLLFVQREPSAPSRPPTPVTTAQARTPPPESALRDLALADPGVASPAETSETPASADETGDDTSTLAETGSQTEAGTGAGTAQAELPEAPDQPDLRELARAKPAVESTPPPSPPAGERPRSGGTVEVRDLLGEQVASGTVAAREPADTAEPAVAPAPTQGAGRFPTIKELRLAGRDLPELRMDVHVYDPDPTGRLVYLNGFKYREGQTTRDEMDVEEITSDGVVLNYRGLRFLLPSR